MGALLRGQCAEIVKLDLWMHVGLMISHTSAHSVYAFYMHVLVGQTDAQAYKCFYLLVVYVYFKMCVVARA